MNRNFAKKSLFKRVVFKYVSSNLWVIKKIQQNFYVKKFHNIISVHKYLYFVFVRCASWRIRKSADILFKNYVLSLKFRGFVLFIRGFWGLCKRNKKFSIFCFFWTTKRSIFYKKKLVHFYRDFYAKIFSTLKSSFHNIIHIALPQHTIFLTSIF